LSSLSLHCPAAQTEKRLLLFELEEGQGQLHIRNEVTGNWYNSIGGTAAAFRYEEPLRPEYAGCFTRYADDPSRH